MHGRDGGLIDGVLGRHNRRTKIPDYAVERPDMPRVVCLYEDRERGEKLIADMRKWRVKKENKRKGPRPASCVEFLFCGMPSYDPPKDPKKRANWEPWTPEKIRAFSDACVDWLRRRVGDAGVVVEAHLHQDETSPHVHASVIAATEDCLRPDKRRLELALIGSPEDLVERTANRHPTVHREVATAILDDFQTAVADRFGLERGNVGGGARQQRPDHVKGLAQRVEAEVERADAAGCAAGEEIERVEKLERVNDLERKASGWLRRQKESAEEAREKEVKAKAKEKVRREAAEKAAAVAETERQKALTVAEKAEREYLALDQSVAAFDEADAERRRRDDVKRFVSGPIASGALRQESARRADFERSMWTELDLADRKVERLTAAARTKTRKPARADGRGGGRKFRNESPGLQSAGTVSEKRAPAAAGSADRNSKNVSPRLQSAGAGISKPAAAAPAVGDRNLKNASPGLQSAGTVSEKRAPAAVPAGGRNDRNVSTGLQSAG